MFDVAMNCDTVYILKKVTWVLVLGYFIFFTSGFKFCFLFMMQLLIKIDKVFPGGIYVLKVNNGNSRMMREICSKLTKNKSEGCQWQMGFVEL